MGLYRAIGDLGFVTGPILLGWLADTKGYSFSLLFNSLFLLLAVIIFQTVAVPNPMPTHQNSRHLVLLLTARHRVSCAMRQADSHLTVY